MQKLNKNNFDSWKDYYFEYQKTLASSYYIPFLINNNVELKDKNILEIGCGNGGFISAFGEFSDNCVGFDLKDLDWKKNNVKYRRLDVFDDNLTNEIDSKFDIREGDNVFDVGCGNGNYVKLFFSKIKEDGLIYGVDKNKNLINEAISKYVELSKNIHFEVGNYDSINIVDVSFNWIFSIYSIYYTADSRALIEKLKDAISLGGKFVIIGPASNNGVDLDDLNFKVTGVLPNQEHIVRTKRIESEFYHLFNRIFGDDNTSLEIVDTAMNFPTIDDYAKYYWSTLLWRESIRDLSADNIQVLKDKTLAILSEHKEYKVSKQMACLIGHNV